MMEAAKIAGALSRGLRGGGPGPRDILRCADAARDRGDWAKAAEDYQRYLELKPGQAAIWVQLGNMLKELRELEASRAAYERALALGLNNSDTQLQLGHLCKVKNDRDGAARYYSQALGFRPINLHAFEELERMGLIDHANDMVMQQVAASLPSGHLVVFDLTDLICYIGNHDNLSGIQRVQCCVIQAMMKYRLRDPEDIRFISYDRELRAFRSIDQEQFLALLDDLALPKERRTVPFDAAAARSGRLFPQEPLAAFLRPGRTTVVLLGAAWVIPEYASLMVNLKRTHDARFAMLFHDFIPIYARETCDQGTAVVFKEFVDQALPIVDLAMCVSRSTEHDLKRYCSESGYTVPPTLVTQLGTSFDEFFPRSQAAAPAKPRQSSKDPYVLFVSTIEGRKNHNFMFEVWRKLIERGLEVPRLVCVGRIGWRAETFLTNVLETDYLGGLIELREDVSDKTLNALYRDCLFTVFPSVYEGWGLPIGESLGHGKLCVLADNSSLPEVAGAFGCYIPLDDVSAAADTIAALLSDHDRLQAYESAIATGFAPLRWEDVARRVTEGCLALQRGGVPAQNRPAIVIGKEYTVKRLKCGFDNIVGPLLIETMREAFAAPITGGNTRATQRVGGLLARDGSWHPPEPWGSWALRDQAGLQLALDPASLADADEVVFYGAFAFVSPMAGARLRMLVGGMSLDDTRIIDSANPVLAWTMPVDQLRRRVSTGDHGLLPIDLRFELTGVTPAMREASRAIDTRELTFGLRSFLFLHGDAMTERLRIAERNGYKLAC